jgi:predicted nicotinamide N-methyase
MDYLSTYPPAPGSRVLDIGCGWGLTGLFLAKQYAAEVTGIDIDESVAPFLALQADINQCAMDFQGRGFETLTHEELASYQTIIGTDICFWDELTGPLFDLLKLAISAGVDRIIIADPGRPPFWALVDRTVEAFDAEVVTRRIYKPWKTEKYMLVIDQT